MSNEEKVEEMKRQQERNLANIRHLGKTEENLFKRLQSNAANKKRNLNDEIKTIDEIDRLGEMRTDMYQEMGQTYRTLTENVVDRHDDLVNQTALQKIVEDEMRKTEKSIDMKEDARNNKLKMIEINTYRAKKIQREKFMVQVIVVGCLNLIALTILYNAKLVGTELAKILFAAIVIFTFIGIVVISLDISKRDNMNFDEYELI